MILQSRHVQSQEKRYSDDVCEKTLQTQPNFQFQSNKDNLR